MQKDPSPLAHRRQNNRSHALALGTLVLSLFMLIGEAPVLAERLDLGLQPFHETTFDDAAPERPAATS